MKRLLILLFALLLVSACATPEQDNQQQGQQDTDTQQTEQTESETQQTEDANSGIDETVDEQLVDEDEEVDLGEMI